MDEDKAVRIVVRLAIIVLIAIMYLAGDVSSLDAWGAVRLIVAFIVYSWLVQVSGKYDI